MGRTTIVLTAARFGGSYLLDALGHARPDDLILQDIFRSGGASLDRLSALLNRPSADLSAMASTDPAALWRLILGAATGQRRNVAAKVYYYHLPREAALWSDLAGSRVVHMIRRNLFDAYLSRVRAEESSLWQTYDAKRVDVSAPPVHVDPKRAQRFIDERCEQIAWARRRFSAAQYHEIAYEDVAAGPMTCRRALHDLFPDIPAMDPEDQIKQGRLRIKRLSNADIIRNYGDVAHLDRSYF